MPIFCACPFDLVLSRIQHYFSHVSGSQWASVAFLSRKPVPSAHSCVSYWQQLVRLTPDHQNPVDSQMRYRLLLRARLFIFCLCVWLHYSTMLGSGTCTKIRSGWLIFCGAYRDIFSKFYHIPQWNVIVWNTTSIEYSFLLIPIFCLNLRTHNSATPGPTDIFIVLPISDLYSGFVFQVSSQLAKKCTSNLRQISHVFVHFVHTFHIWSKSKNV